MRPIKMNFMLIFINYFEVFLWGWFIGSGSLTKNVTLRWFFNRSRLLPFTHSFQFQRRQCVPINQRKYACKFIYKNYTNRYLAWDGDKAASSAIYYWFQVVVVIWAFLCIYLLFSYYSHRDYSGGIIFQQLESID